MKAATIAAVAINTSITKREATIPPMRDELLLFEVLLADGADLDALTVPGLLDEFAGSGLLGEVMGSGTVDISAAEDAGISLFGRSGRDVEADVNGTVA